MTDFDVSEAPERETCRCSGKPPDFKQEIRFDVGCGAGWITRIMAQLGADVIGIDPENHGSWLVRVP